MQVGFNVSAGAIYFALGMVTENTFVLVDSDRLLFSFTSQSSMLQTYEECKTLIQDIQAKHPDTTFAYLRLPEGKYSASYDNVKAEGLLELAFASLNIDARSFTNRALSVQPWAKGGRWQDKIAEALNSEKKIKYWNVGVNGAAAVSLSNA